MDDRVHEAPDAETSFDVQEFERQVTQAADDKDYAELYRLWIGIIEKKYKHSTGPLRVRLSGIQLDPKRLENDEYAENLKPLHGEMQRVWPEVSNYWPEQDIDLEFYLTSVAGAADSACCCDSDALERLDALLDLVVTAHRYSPEDQPTEDPSAFSEWREEVARQARALTDISCCKPGASLTSFPVPASESAAAVAGYEDDGQNAEFARLLLCVRLESRKLRSAEKVGPDRLRSLAKRIADGEGCENADSDDIERLLNHHVFESRLARHLLHEWIGYKPWNAPSRAPNIGSLDRLELDVMMMGPRKVGKSSFLFASESHHEAMRDGTEFNLEWLAGDKEQKKTQLDEARRCWENGEHSKTLEITIAARAGPRKLCRFNIVDTRGEDVSKGKETEESYDELRKHVWQSPRPSVFLLMLSMDESDVVSDERIASILKTCFSRPGGEPDGGDKLVYIVFNKFDLYLKSLKEDGAASDLLANLATEMGGRAFHLSQYFAPPEIQSWDGVESEARDSMRRHRELGSPAGAGGQCSDAARRIVIEAFDKRSTVFKRLWGMGAGDIRLCFVSSACDPDKEIGDSFPPGVGAFWGDLWDRVEVFKKTRAEIARRVFVENLKMDAEAALDLESNVENNGKGLLLPDPFESEEPFFDNDWRKEGRYRYMAELVRHGGGSRAADGDDDIRRSLRRLCEDARCEGLLDILDWGDQLAESAGSFNSRWEKALQRTIGELNASDIIHCEEFDAADNPEDAADNPEIEKKGRGGEHDPKGEETREARRENWRERKKLTPEDFDGYAGLQRGPSLAGDPDQWRKLSPGAREWLLDTHAGMLLWEAVRRDIEASRGDGDGKDEEALSEEAEEALWHVADYIHEGGQTNWHQKYSCFAPRRGWGTDRLLVLSLLEGDVDQNEKQKVEPEERIGEIVEMVRSLAAIRRNVDGLDRWILELTAGFVASCLLDGMGFDIARIGGICKTVEEASKEVAKAAAGAKFGPGYFKQRRKALMDCAEKLDEHAISGRRIVLLRGRYGGFDDAQRKLGLLRLAVQAADKGARSLDWRETYAKVRRRRAQVNKLRKEHRRRVSTYVKNTVKRLLELHRRWLERAVDLRDDERRWLRWRCSAIVSEMEVVDKKQDKIVDNALEIFREIVEERAPERHG